jgi:tetratricopeptide (TPR) repeat protein
MLQIIAAFLMMLSNFAAAKEAESASGIFFLEQGKYSDAKEAFQNDLVDLEAGSTFFNLAYSELKLGDTSSALLHLIKARELLPRYANIQYFMTEVEKNKELKFFERSTVTSSIFGLHRYLNEYESWLLAACFLAASSLICLGILLFRKRTFAVFYPFFLSLYLIGGGIFKSLSQAEWLVSKMDTSLHATPSPSSDQLANVSKSSPLKVIRNASGWAYVEVSTGMKGWVNETDFVRLEE